MEKRLIEVNMGLQRPHFSLSFLPGSAAGRRAPPERCRRSLRCGQEEEEKGAYSPAGTDLQVLADRSNYSCKEVPAGVGSSGLFSTQRNDLCDQLHLVTDRGTGTHCACPRGTLGA